ncbi:MAG: arsenate reductase ArsC [Bacteroidia bacterium]|nr:arsenate reductase ArsC [Bacteroidia bacterium]
MKKVLFVCIENSNRSQMAQAFGMMMGRKDLIFCSAGSRPSGKINSKAIAAMKELSYDLSVHESKSVDYYRSEAFDAVVTMGCGDECPFIPARHRFDWQIPDPRDMDMAEFRKVRDLIKDKVIALIPLL